MLRAFLLIELLLKLIGLWEQFSSYVQAQKLIEDEEKRQRREKAIEDSKKAETDEEIWKSQDGIVDNSP